MIIKELYDELYYGHDVKFEYNGIKYFIEHSKQGLELYKLISEDNGQLIGNINNQNKETAINDFMNAKLLYDKKSILEVYDNVKILDIE